MSDPKELVPVRSDPWAPPAYLRLALSLPGLARVHDGLFVAGRIDNPADRAAVFSAQHGDSLSLADFAGKEVPVHAWLAHWHDRIDEATGANTGYWRTVLLGADGDRYQTASVNVLRALCDLVGHAGPPPWNPAVRLKVVTGKMAGGYRFITVEWVQAGAPLPPEDF